ncbi:MAG: hypothetical protein Q9167_005218 [Letrouitia subvulpina]
MDGSNQGNTDRTSIKPVSSLRSHFESISNQGSKIHSTSNSFALQVQAPLEDRTGDSIPRERVSLDVPRRSPSWVLPNSPNSGNSREAIKDAKQDSTVALNFNPSPRPRSTSVGSTSPPQSPPSFSIDQRCSRRILPSPHKDVRPPPISQPQVHSANPALSFRPRVSSPKPTKLVSYNALTSDSHPKLPSAQRPSTPKAEDKDQLISGSRRFPASPTPWRAPKVQNPLDRAPTPGSITGTAESGLEPSAPAGFQKISPFSTPPSSNSSPDLDPSRDMKVGVAQSSPKRSGDYFPKNDGLASAKIGASEANVGTSQIYSKPPSAAPEHSGLPSTDQQGRRPGLPPRPSASQRQQYHLGPPKVPTKRMNGHAESNHGAQDAPLSVTAGQGPKSSMATGQSFLPPPRRQQTGMSHDAYGSKSPLRTSVIDSSKDHLSSFDSSRAVENQPQIEFPDGSCANRRPPLSKVGLHVIETTHDTKFLDISGQHICASGYLTRAWDSSTGEMALSLAQNEREVRVTAMAFKPGATTDREGSQLWLGTDYGDLQEVDIATQSISHSKPNAHSRREVIKIYRHQNSMWTLDEEGKLYVWEPDAEGLPNLDLVPLIKRVPKGHTFSIVIEDALWLATGKDIRVFRPHSKNDNKFCATPQPLHQPGVGEVTSAAVLSSQLDRAYFGHTDGKITIYSVSNYSCMGVVNVSVYKINALAGAGSLIWAAYNTGTIHVYNTETHPWKITKDWRAHDGPAFNLTVDRSSLWRSGTLVVASMGADNTIKFWDGLLEDDWLDSDLHDHDTEYCNFHEIKALVVTWNAGAATPSNLRQEERDSKLFQDILQNLDPPDLIVFGFQELVDLEDKKLTAKSLFLNSRKHASMEQEHMSHQYRAWRDYLIRCVEDVMPAKEPYSLLHAINLGALISRFSFEDTSLCFINCHLAAGQSQTLNRNSDLTAILESSVFPAERNASTRCDSYMVGGDGSMILDHEICVLSGDLNYRIDTMGRDTIARAIAGGNLAKLLDRDQLLVSRRRNPAFRLRAFTECPISFNPTYKYDVGSDRYDTSEKHRSPAWCDRILYRGPGKIKQLSYQRHELRVSDHRPVTGSFVIRVKSVSASKRKILWQQCTERFQKAKDRLQKEAK